MEVEMGYIKNVTCLTILLFVYVIGVIIPL